MMKAVRFHGKKDIRLENIEIPKCGKGKVKVSCECRRDAIAI